MFNKLIQINVGLFVHFAWQLYNEFLNHYHLLKIGQRKKKRDFSNKSDYTSLTIYRDAEVVWGRRVVLFPVQSSFRLCPLLPFVSNGYYNVDYASFDELNFSCNHILERSQHYLLSRWIKASARHHLYGQLWYKCQRDCKMYCKVRNSVKPICFLTSLHELCIRARSMHLNVSENNRMFSDMHSCA